MGTTAALPYDPASRRSIVEYAHLLVGSTLREQTGVASIASPQRRKGSFGNAVEEHFFGYAPNSAARADFPQAGLELKTTPLKRAKRGGYVAKERLVFCMLNFGGVVDETFETSTLLAKCSDILLISYLWEPEVDPLDYVILIADEWTLPAQDMPQFKRDWETVVAKVRAGRAHEISGSDTLYLEACTKGKDSSARTSQPFSDIPAKPRAWALKASYMTAISQGLLEQMETLQREQGEEDIDVLTLVRKRFEPYFGMTETELERALSCPWAQTSKRRPKHACALMTNRILGVGDDAKIAEFEKAGIKPKTMRLQRNGRPKEAVSFPAFDYCALALTDFEDSDFLCYLQQRWLFVVYREDDQQRGVYRLNDVMLWQMPDDDIGEARRCYEEMRERVMSGHAEQAVRSSENRCCHVRPHGKNAADTCMTPYGVPVKKQCFWLNQGYLQGEIARLSRT